MSEQQTSSGTIIWSILKFLYTFPSPEKFGILKDTAIIPRESWKKIGVGRTNEDDQADQARQVSNEALRILQQRQQALEGQADKISQLDQEKKQKLTVLKNMNFEDTSEYERNAREVNALMQPKPLILEA